MSIAGNSQFSLTKPQIRQSHPHVMHQRVRETVSDRCSQQGMNDTQRVNAPVSAKHLSKEKCTDDGHDRKSHVGQMSQSKQEAARGHRPESSDQRFYAE